MALPWEFCARLGSAQEVALTLRTQRGAQHLLFVAAITFYPVL
jgi:hypothetical protein